MTIIIGARALEAFVADIFAAAGCSKAEGGRIGRYLVSANLSGHDSHGVVRVPRYASQKQRGTVVPDVEVEVVVDTPVIAVVDGKYGFGQTVTPQAVQIGIDKCRRNGLAAVTLRNAGHVGRVGDWAEMAAEAGFVSVHFVNASGSVLVAPYGGVERRFSTAPYCVGVPRPGQDPLVLDFATSIVAEGKVLVASQGGKKVPDGALIGPDGKPSSDPHLLYGAYTPTGPRDHSQGTGAIRAFGDHKGSGLAFMCEVLGGSLSGTGATDPKRGRFANGMLSFYIDPKVFDPVGFFPVDVAKYVDFVKGSAPATPGGDILVPGEPEARMRAERQANGVPLPDDTWAAIVETARSVGLDERRIQQATM
ncbi:MAG: malate/lactate/ureidoglycolate dehydrogenase [Alphaproteobacteria bacterium]|nr:malate/lactate/ureidoglycolate dehydrogenase [Alphaproteobacteria bacterium]